MVAHDAQIERLYEALHDWALGDVRRAAEAGAKVGAFILAANLIDVLARLAYSKPKKNDRGAWEEFVPDYLPPYGDFAYPLYRDFRSALSHNYSLNDMRLVDGPEQEYRHGGSESGHRVLHLESFIEEVQAAVDRFFERVRADEALRERVLSRARERPPLGIVGPDTPTVASGPVSSETIVQMRANATYWSPNIEGAQAASGAAWPEYPPGFRFEPPAKPPEPAKRIPKKRKTKKGRPK